MVQQAFAGLVLAACALLLLRLLIGERRRYRFDAAARRIGLKLQRVALSLQRKMLALWHWRASRQRAAKAAEDAIRRAADGAWDGNVYKPKSFRKPPRDKLH